MTTLQWAVEHYPTVMHDALRKAARVAFSLRIAPRPHVLHTVCGSLAHGTRIGDSPWTAVTTDDGKDQTKDKDGRPPAVGWNVPLWSSKVGGFGFLPRAAAYPTSTIAPHRPLQLIAQVNFGELWAQAAAGGMEVSAQQRALWPERGLLALYVDGADDVYGCTFEPKSAQDGYRILFFDEELRPVEEVLQQLHAGALDVAAAEAALAPLMWSREAQYEQFESLLRESDFTNARPSRPRDSEVSDDAWKEIADTYLRHLIYPVDDAHPLDPRLPPSAKGGPSLWYGDLITQEYPVSLGSVEQMVPHRSSDFGDLVAAPTLTAHPELAPPKEDDPSYSYYTLARGDSYVLRAEGEEDAENCFDDIKSIQDHIGGFPFFTQEDVREQFINLGELLERGHATDEELRQVAEKDVVLLQLSSTSPMMWGDAGACNLFIAPADLQAKRFDKAWYNWDCC